jgi:hypothetical protein
MSNYLLVKEVINVVNVKELSKEFNEKFKEGDNISEKEFKEMCGKYISEGGESYYINLNWKYIMSGGDNEILINEG